MTQSVNCLTKTGRGDEKWPVESDSPDATNVTEVRVRLGNKQLRDLVG